MAISDQHPSQPFNDNSVRHMPDPIRSVRNIAFEAQARRHWIYDPRTKDWFTPGEFEQKFGRTPSNQEFLDQVQIRDPADGIKAGYKTLDAVRSKLEIFTKRVVDYYREGK